MTITGFEIDFLAVGEESSSGDAILFRYKEENGEFKIILIDGGHKKSGNVETSDTILNHMRTYYNNATHIDHIVCSHPDADHIGGLEGVMDKCTVGKLWINDPCDYANRSELAEESDPNRFSKADADKVEALKKLAKDKGVPVCSPVQGCEIGPLTVASPSKEFYKGLVKGQLDRQGGGQASFKKAALGVFTQVAKTIMRLVPASWKKDELMDYPATSVCNESSTVLFCDFNEDQILLTADAGIEALSRAYEYLESIHGFKSGSLTFIQMPHHGSRRNINVEILNKLLGNKLPEGGFGGRGSSYASVAKEAKKHPKRSVANAFFTRGYLWDATKGAPIRFSSGDMPYRNWRPIEFTGFYYEVEELEN